MDKILISHGSGGKKTTELLQNLIFKYFDDKILKRMDDSAILGKQVFTTDSFVVNPLFFPGGDIGKLAVCGTINDISVMGAKPKYLSSAFIIEEGFKINDLERIISSMKKTAESSAIRIVTGDTKVVEKGKCDGIYINTSGIGSLVFSKMPDYQLVEPGDIIIINGFIGLHEIAVLSKRNDFKLDLNIKSDVAPLWSLIKNFKNYNIKFMTDPTRGGIAQSLNEIVDKTEIGIKIEESKLPLTPQVSSVCEMLGFDPLHLANEGKVIVIVSKDDADKVLKSMKEHPLGKDSVIIGKITKKNKGYVTIKTKAFSERIVMPPSGELLPRIC